MPGMGKEFCEFSVGATRLRVISDCADDIDAVIDGEKKVIGSFAAGNLWPHDAVTLFVLENLAPLIGQLRQLHGLADQEALLLPRRPMVNLYDLRHPHECFVFVNRQVMVAEDYWGDPLAVEALLAHEHAHPVAECPAAMASRSLKIVVDAPAAGAPLLAQLAETLSSGAVTELFANDICIANGFDEALAHLDRITVAHAVRNLAQRPELQQRMKAATAAGTLNAGMTRLLILLADAQNTLPFVLELSPFFRMRHARQGGEIEEALRTRLFPYLEPGIEEMFFALHDLYLRLRPDWNAGQLRPWCDAVLASLSMAFDRCGEKVALRLSNEETTAQSTRIS